MHAHAANPPSNGLPKWVANVLDFNLLSLLDKATSCVIELSVAGVSTQLSLLLEGMFVHDC